MHLAEAGETDVLLLERAQIAAGTSWHAAGLLARVRGTHAMTELASYGVDRYARLEGQTGIPIGYNPNGSITLARHPGRVDELRAAAAIGRHHDIPCEILTPAQVTARWPLASSEGVLAGLLMPGDGTVNPGWAALAFAKGAHDLGVTIREGVRVASLRVRGEGGRAARDRRSDRDRRRDRGGPRRAVRRPLDARPGRCRGRIGAALRR